MKKFILLLLGLILPVFFAQNVFAQNNFGNEWIRSGNTYKKIKIAQEGIYRISAAELNHIGFGNVAGNQFALFRDGKEVPIYTSTGGSFGSNDYILFYGSPANGAVNTALYPNVNYQPDTLKNLFTDSATYFLTHDNLPHKRLSQVNNAIPSPSPSPAPYCWSVVLPTNNPKAYLAGGKSYDNMQEYFYSSTFDFGEGYTYNARSQKSTTLHFPSAERYTGNAPSATVSFVFGSNTNIISLNHHLAIKKGSFVLFDTSFSGYQYIRRMVAIPGNQISPTNTAITFADNQLSALYSAVLKYPRTFNFSGNFSSQAAFGLPAGQRYLEISNFTSGSTPPLLFDLSNDKFYSGNVSGNQVKFYLDNNSGAKKMFLANNSSITNLTGFQQVQFRDFSQAANQGDYIILTHKDYMNASPNYVQQFANYRSSQQGGGHQPVIVNVTDLYDQFGYGYDYDPISIRRFIHYAEANWAKAPEYLFIIGKGVIYNSYSSYLEQSGTYNFPLVPTWGHPGSDNLLSATNTSQQPTLATGRLSVYTNQEIGDYLEKVKAYELALKPATLPTSETELWKKRALHIAGSSDINLQVHLKSTLNNCAVIYKDTLIGGMVKTIAKNTTDPTEGVDDPTVDSLINKGINVLGFYGHASSSGFDYNLNNPDVYHANPRFPVFFAFGCDVAQIFKLTNQKTVSEDYIHSENGGAIAMVAEDNYGYTSTLPQYMTEMYKAFCYRNYGTTIGKQYQLNTDHLLSINSSDYMKIHTQCLLFQGDPAVSLYNPAKPDYAVETGSLSANPANVSISIDSFDLKAVVYNLGKSSYDTVTVILEHTHAGNNTITFADTVRLVKLMNTDTLYFRIPVDPIKDIGMNNYTLRIDPEQRYDEISEQNNQATLQLFIYANSLEPVYPPRFSIVHEQDVTLKASTLNAFAQPGKYKFQIDTTTKFNSPLLQSTEITSEGGVLKWKPGIALQDSVVYYWRTAPDSLMNGERKWSVSSFVYLANGSDGWNQSHYFQYLNDEMLALDIPEGSRKFAFAPAANRLLMENKIIYPSSNDYDNVRQVLNDVLIDRWGCGFSGSIRIMVIDKNSGLPWKNPANVEGKYGSISVSNCNHSDYTFDFYTKSLAGRDSAIKMIERVPQGDYIMIANLIYGGPPGPAWDRQTAEKWKADTAVLGSGNSLYHAIKNLGFTDIDQFDAKKAFIFFRKKGDNGYPVYQMVASDSVSKITLPVTFNSYPDTGKLASTVIGPAKKWEHLSWRNDPAVSNPQNDHPFVSIFGIDSSGTEDLLQESSNTDISLLSVDPKHYPNLRLVWNSVDTVNRTSANLKYWRVLYQPVPEAALNAASHLTFIDSLNASQHGKLELSIENLTPYPMDSMLVRYKIIDAGNVAHLLAEKRYKKLGGNDTLVANLDFNADQYPGKNFLFIEANPDNDQPEQYHPNNVGYLPFSMKADKENPLLDVTFDGVHILDKDIVSAKPLIKILLKDNSEYAFLNDTSLLKVQLLSPGSASPKSIPFDGKTCMFFPASSNDKQNEARVEYRPALEKDGTYKLIVTGKDKSGNVAGGTASKYEVRFTVENKPSITNVLNYPNPFSTATQFLFTMTGSEIPSQFKIQILTVTGKVVREITKDELGPLHIGRNITEYRWDGTDQSGQMLGNGVYLYRVITSIRGKEIEHRSNATVDKFFKKGYGKLYIMR